MVAQSPEPGAHVLNARAFRIELEFRNVVFAENRSTRRKTSRSREENQQQTQPTYDVESGNRTRATLVEGECSHHFAIPAPPSSTKRRLTMCSNMHFVRPLTTLCHVDSTLYLTFLLRNQDKLLLVQLYILFSFNTSVNIYYTEKIFLNTFRKIMLTVVTVLSHRKQLSDSNMNSAC